MGNLKMSHLDQVSAIRQAGGTVLPVVILTMMAILITLLATLDKILFISASDKYPVSIYAKDFDKNRSLDAIVTIFLKDQTGVKKEYTAMNRDDIVGQLPGVRKKFLTYKEFAKADIHQIFSEDEMKEALILRANNFKSCYLEK